MSQIELKITSWDDVPDSARKLALSWYSDDLNLRIFAHILKHHNIVVHNEQFIELFTIVDWEFLKTPPNYALIAKYRWYKMPEARMVKFKAFEFQLLEKYYSQISNGDLSYIPNLTKLVLGIGKYQDENQLIAAGTPSLPDYFITNIIKYAEGNLIWFSNLYTKAITRSSTPSVDDGLGWTSTFLGIAESGVFGDINAVWQTNIHLIMAYLIKKSKEAETHEREMNRTGSKP